MYFDFDDYYDPDAIRRRQYQRTKRQYEEKGYIVSDDGEVSYGSRPWQSEGYIDENGDHHSYM